MSGCRRTIIRAIRPRQSSYFSAGQMLSVWKFTARRSYSSRSDTTSSRNSLAPTVRQSGLPGKTTRSAASTIWESMGLTVHTAAVFHDGFSDAIDSRQISGNW